MQQPNAARQGRAIRGRRVRAFAAGTALVVAGGWIACDRSKQRGESPLTDDGATQDGSGATASTSGRPSSEEVASGAGGGVGDAGKGGTNGGAGTASFEIPTNTLTANDVPPIPPYWELLYVVGTDTPGTIHTFLVDGDTLYWVQQSLIWRAPKDGSGPPLAFGWYESTNQGSRLLMDDTYIYWHDGATIKRKRKDSSADSPSNALFNFNFPEGTRYQEDTESIEFGGDYPVGLFDVSAGHAYIAHPSCTPLHVVDLETLDVKTIEFERPEYGGGAGDLRVKDGEIFCANYHWLFKISPDGSKVETIKDDFQGVQAMEFSGDWLYVADKPAGSVSVSVLRGTKEGMFTDFGQAPYVSYAGQFSSPVIVDDGRGAVYVLGSGGNLLSVLDLETGQYSSLSDVRIVYAFGADEDYLYYAGRMQTVPNNWTSTILRLHKDQLDEAIEAASAGP